MNIEELEEMAESDLSYDIMDADSVCLKIPALKSKWCSILYRAELEASAAELKMKATYKTLHEAYLTGNKTNNIVDRRDVDKYITGDPEYLKVYARYELEKGVTKYIEGVLKAIDNMSFSIQAAIKWRIFKEGG